MAQSKQTHQDLQVETLERREMLSGTPQLVFHRSPAGTCCESLGLRARDTIFELPPTREEM